MFASVESANLIGGTNEWVGGGTPHVPDLLCRKWLWVEHVTDYFDEEDEEGRSMNVHM